MSELEKVIDRQANTVGIIGDYAGHPIVEYGSVHEHEGDVLLLASRDDVVLQPCSGEDETIDLSRPQRVQNRRFRFPAVVRVREHRDVTLLSESPFDRPHDRREQGIREIRNNDADGK